MKKLNGWQRLWMVGTVALGICTIGFGVKNLDTKSSLLDKHERQVNDNRSRIAELKSRKDSHKPLKIWDKILNEEDPETRINELKSSTINLNNQLESNLKTVNSELFQGILILFSLWLSISTAAYLSGLIIHWIYRGFRPSREI